MDELVNLAGIEIVLIMALLLCARILIKVMDCIDATIKGPESCTRHAV